jgi:hypothetical protein
LIKKNSQLSNVIQNTFYFKNSLCCATLHDNTNSHIPNIDVIEHINVTHNNQHLVFEHVYGQRYFTINKKKLAKLDIQDKRRRQIKQKHNTICVGNHSAQTKTNNIKHKTCSYKQLEI